MGNEFTDIRDLKEQIEPFQKVKPENLSLAEARSFWDGMFSHEIECAADIREFTQQEVNELQIKEIDKAFEKIKRGVKLSDVEKGNFGEMLMDQYYISKGYIPIKQLRVTDLSNKSGPGIDGVYERINSDGSKSFVIADAKVNHSKLNKRLADGTNQMSDAWIDKRLDDAVGKEKADEIRDYYEDDPDSVSKEVYHFSYDDSGINNSTADISIVDENGNQSREKTVVQIFDLYGRAIPIGEHDDKR